MKTKRNSCFLIIAAFIWGTAFVAQSTGGDLVGPYTFNCIRTFVGSIVLIPVILLLDKTGISSKKPSTRSDRKMLWIGGICCGIVLCIASNLQQVGLHLGTSAGKAGFLTACYIVLVPILGLFLKKKCGWNVWISVVITVCGLYLLCIKGSFALQFSDLLVLICSLCFSIHILVIDHFSPLVDGVRMSCIQFLVCGILTAIPMFVSDARAAGMASWITSLQSGDAWFAILYAGILSSGVAYTLQIVGQNDVNPTIASLLMSLESVFAVLAGWAVLHERMSRRELLGCLLIFIAVVLAQVPVNNILRKKRNKN